MHPLCLQEARTGFLVTVPPERRTGFPVGLGPVLLCRCLPLRESELDIECPADIFVLLVLTDTEPFGQGEVDDVQKPVEGEAEEIDTSAAVFSVKGVPDSWLAEPSAEGSDGSVGRMPYSPMTHSTTSLACARSMGRS
jgi:hypothetical protein